MDILSKSRLTLAACLLTAASVQAQTTVFNETFDTYTAGQTVPTGTAANGFNFSVASTGTPTTTPNGTTGTFSSLVQQDTGNLFGQGTSANYLDARINNVSTSDNAKYVLQTNTLSGTGLGMLGQISFQFNQQAAGTNAGYNLRLGNGLGNANQAFALGLRSGSFYALGNATNPSGTLLTGTGGSVTTQYTFATTNLLTVVFNNSATTRTYNNGVNSGSLAAQTVDLYLNGTLIGNDITNAVNGAPAAGTLNANVNEFQFQGVATSTNAANPVFNASLYLNNINAAALVPEPSTVCLSAVALAAGGVAMARRRKGRGPVALS